jgi:carboxyl-terminal processing protease
MERNMKNKFLAGLLSGVVGVILIAAIGFFLKPVILGDNFRIGQTNDKDNFVDSTNVDEIIDKLNNLGTVIDQFYMEEVDEETLVEGIYKGYVAGLGDPYSTYYTQKEYDALMESSSGVYFGIGASVSQDVTTGIITIVKPFVSGPAYEAGILPGDIIYKVGEEEVTGKDLTEVVSKLKGPDGTQANLTILREGEEKELEFTLPRRKIEVPTIEYTMLDNNVGYISILEFDKITAEQFRDAIEDLDKQGQEGLIIDVRNNPGGLLDVVTDMLDRMLPEGLIVYTEDKYGNREEKTSDNEESFDKPLVVLINGNSASASEIFAGAIQDYELGTLVGTTTFGKGIVQSIYPLPDDTAIKVTVSKYFTPKGRNIHGVGIDPDVEVELNEELRRQVVIEKSEDNQLQKGIEVLESKMK